MKKNIRMLLSVVTMFLFFGCKDMTGEAGNVPAEPAGNKDNAMAVTYESAQAVVPVGQPVNQQAETLQFAETHAQQTVRPSGKDIQQALKNTGLYSGEIDGIIGPRTEKAIKDFQQKNDLEADGKVGEKTWGKLKGYVGVSASNESYKRVKN